MEFITDNTTLWRYCEFASNQVEGAVNTGSVIKMKCNVCGDGDSGKKRGHLIYDKSRNIIYYKCFNYGDCDAAEKAWGASRWLKSYFPVFYKQYVTELLQTHGKSKKQKEKPIEKAKVKLTEEEKLLLAEEQSNAKDFKPILKAGSSLSAKAIGVCMDRQLPGNIWKKFFVCNEGLYKGRMIIPFYDNTGGIYYYQARDLVGRIPKYLNRKLGRDDAIYNWFSIDNTKPVMVTEGPIDSMFLENAVATMGLSFTNKVQAKLDSINSYYLLDNDLAGYKKSIELIKERKYVFLWKKFLKEKRIPDKYKDINDVFVYLKREQKFNFEELSKYFSNHYLDQIYLR
tara:strand:+ start:19224 stop:20249 length:1026 start_codon:yes stop_codon:yes gene_type:complete